MKLVIATVAALTALTATTAHADSMWTFGGDLDANYAVDAERMTVDIEPALTFTPADGLNFVTSTELALWDNELVADTTIETMPTIAFEVNYTMGAMDSVEYYAKTKYNLEATAREEIHIGATFSF